MPPASRRISALPLAASETIIFRVRQSVILLVIQISVLSLVGLAFVLVVQSLTSIGSPVFGSVSLKDLLLLGGLGAIALVIIVRLLDFATTSYTLTNRRVQRDFGILLKTSYAIPLNQVETLDVQQSLFGRLLGYGDLEIRPTSAVIRFIEFTSLADPKGRREQVEAQLP